MPLAFSLDKLRVVIQLITSEVCLALNTKCHASTKEMLKQDAVAPHSIETARINLHVYLYH